MNVCQYEIPLSGRNFHYGKDHIGHYDTYLYFEKHSPYTESFNRKILILHHMGVLFVNQARFVAEIQSSDCYVSLENIDLIK